MKATRTGKQDPKLEPAGVADDLGWDGRTPIPERLLARLWQKRAARQRHFKTQGGRRVQVLYPGRPSSSAGPDFRDALLNVEGVGLVHGDVEIHLRQRDWQNHGHGTDPNYNGVVLHAALEVDPKPTNLQSGRPVPVISLQALLDENEPSGPPPRSSLWAILLSRGYAPPESLEEMGELLDRAGDARFLHKSGRFQLFLAEQPPDQVLYEGLAEALGYRHNQQAFLKLAARAPYSKLERAAGGMPQEGWAAAIESWLIQLSGLSPTAAAAGTALPRVGFGPPLSPPDWHCFRVRPSNHPRRRIAGLAGLLARFLGPGLVAGLEQIADAGSSAGGPKELTAALTVYGRPGQSTAVVGQDRARDLAVNVVLPFCHGLAAGRGDENSGSAYLELYRRFGRLQDNELTREMADELMKPAWRRVSHTARRQQGLLHLHRLLTGSS